MLGFSPLAAAPLGDDGGAEGGGLFAVSIVAGAAVVGSASLGQGHALGAAAVASGAAVVSVPTFSEINGFTSTGITAGAPTLGTAPLQQTHSLSGAAIVATAVVGAASLGQEHALSAATVTSGAVALATPQIAQTHAFDSTGIAAGPVTVGRPTAKQIHNLTSVALTGAAVAFLPPGPRLRNRWALTAVALTAGAPVLSAATLGEFYATRRRHVSVTLSDDVQPVADLTSDVMVMSSTNAVAIEVDGSVVEVYGGANFAAADNANSAVGAYVGQTQAE